MPDADVERMAGDGLDPTTELVISLRHRLVGEWRGDVVDTPPPVPARPRRVWWMATAAVIAVMVLVGWLGTQRGPATVEGPASSTSSTASTASTVSTTTSLPAGSIPTTVLGRQWVVTAVDGVPVPGPAMPTFTFEPDGRTTGFDGCNDYAIDDLGEVTPGLPCPGVEPVVARGPFTFDLPLRVETAHFRAERFDRIDGLGSAPPLAGTYAFGGSGTLTLGDGGRLSVAGAGCETATTGAWTVDNDRLQLAVDVPDCFRADPSFADWLQQMQGGARVSFHDGDTAGLWTSIDFRVTRLVRLLDVQTELAGHTWVITSVHGQPVTGPLMPTFVVDPDGSVAGWDGCNSYSIGTDGSTSTDLACPGVTPAVARPPFAARSSTTLQAGDLVAESFDSGISAPGVVYGTWGFGARSAVTFGRDGTLLVSDGGCSGAGTFTVDAGRVTIGWVPPGACEAGDHDFEVWLAALTKGAAFSFHDGVGGGLWTQDDGAVARLGPGGPAAFDHARGTDATPDESGLRVAGWTGAELAALGVVLDDTHLGVLLDGSLASLTADGTNVIVVDTRGNLRATIPVDPGAVRLAVRPGDVAALTGRSGESRFRLRQPDAGVPVPPGPRVTIDGPSANCTFDVQLGGRQWIVQQPDCTAELLDPVALDNGSVIALTRSTVVNDPNTQADDLIQLGVMRLNADGSHEHAVLGRHAVDGAEGWVTVQATETGAFVVFHYADDAVVLYRYLFG